MTTPTLPTLDIEQIAREVDCTHVNLNGDRAMAIERLSRFAAEVARRSSMGAEPVAYWYEGPLGWVFCNTRRGIPNDKNVMLNNIESEFNRVMDALGCDDASTAIEIISGLRAAISASKETK